MTAPPNKTLLQTFEWHTSSNPPNSEETHSSGSHYSRLLRRLPSLFDLGITTLWLPPGCKANNPDGNGYDCYDLWDLGEFKQKVVRSTKWGSREELADLIQAAHNFGLDVIWDAVLNHKTAGDDKQECWAVEVDPNDRRVETCAPKQVEAWLKYDFPGRGNQYSAFKWRHEHFNGTDWDDRGQRHAIFKVIDEPTKESTWRKLINPRSRAGKGWAEDVSKMYGNYDYLLLSNIYHKHDAVRQDLIKWGEWMIKNTQIDGFRLDAAQHFSYAFSKEWIGRMRACRQTSRQKPPLIIGEVWSPDIQPIVEWLDTVGQDTFAFDSPLVYTFSNISQARSNGQAYDLRRIASGSLTSHRPNNSITVVSNHDTQRGQASYVPMEGHMKMLFYAFTLLRKDGLPCVFWGDLYGIEGPYPETPACQHQGRSVLPDLILARTLFAYGEQQDIFDAADCIAWRRLGASGRPGCIVLISNKPSSQLATKTILVGGVGDTWIDVLSARNPREVVIDNQGIGNFFCTGCSAAVYVQKNVEYLSRFPVAFDRDI